MHPGILKKTILALVQCVLSGGLPADSMGPEWIWFNEANPATRAPGFRFLRREHGRSVFAAGAGKYASSSSYFQIHSMPVSVSIPFRCLPAIAMLLAAVGPAAQAAGVTPVGLRAEHAATPVGIDAEHPRLSWRMQADRPGAAQTAYQIEVVGLWDSGKVASDRSIAIPYGGPPLASATTCQWRVRVWDEKGEASPWSEPARWTTGLLRPDDWQGLWLGPPAATPGPAFAPGRLSIQKASYRTPDGTVTADVTEKARQLFSDGRNALTVDFQQIGTDPAPGVQKELVIEYTLDGKADVSAARDNEPLRIPRGPTGDVAWWFRRDFDLSAVPSSAIFTIHSPAYFEVHVNGKKAGGDVLTPAVSDLPDRSFTVSYDVANLLRPGNNTIGVWLGTGWSNTKGFRAQLNAVAGGRNLVVASDDKWLARPSPYSRIGGRDWNNFGGERIDAAFDLPDWSRPGIDLAGWICPALLPSSAAPGMPVNQPAPLNRIGERIAAKRITALADGRYEIDFGTNLTGWLEMKLPKLEANRLVRFHFADRVFPDGKMPTPSGEVQVQQASCIGFKRADGGTNSYQTYNQTSEFVSAGRSGEVFTHKFNYAGFRHVVIDGLPAAPRLEDATALLVESDLAPTGAFECSDARLNRIHQVNAWTLRCLNLGGYPVDCPHRERMGYGDGQVYFEGMMSGFDATRFYEKWFGDWRDAQNPDGSSTFIAPAFSQGGGGPPWPGIIAEGPWLHYLHYGDPSILEQNLAHAVRYAGFLDCARHQ